MIIPGIDPARPRGRVSRDPKTAGMRKGRTQKVSALNGDSVCGPCRPGSFVVVLQFVNHELGIEAADGGNDLGFVDDHF